MPPHARQRREPRSARPLPAGPDQGHLMIDFSLEHPLTACAMLLFASDSSCDWLRRHMGSISRNAVFLPFAVFVALTANSAIAAAAYPLTFADVLNQF